MLTLFSSVERVLKKPERIRLFYLYMIKAVLFDNDGVLVDTETLFFQTTRRAFSALGLRLDPQSWARRYLTQAKSSKDIAISMGADPARVAEMLEDRNRKYWQVLQKPPQ